MVERISESDEPESKRRKEGSVLIQLRDESGNDCGDPIEVPHLINPDQLGQLTNRNGLKNHIFDFL